MFYSGDDDENDFMPTAGRTKLASLFGLDSTNEPSSNESLTYKAPTEPKKKMTSDTSQKTSPSVLTAAAVFAYKYVDNQYASQGKLGAAVIGNQTLNDYKILLYYTKEKPVAFATINTSFSFVIQPSNYASFYDDSRQNWSLMFESEASLTQFVKQVAFSKTNSNAGGASKLEDFIIQDITRGDGSTLEMGDSVELKYSAWIFNDGSLGPMFDSSESSEKPLRFRIGKVKTSKIWEEGVIGMSKGSQRLLILPPSLPYDFDGKIGKAPPGSVIVFELEVLRVKFVRDRSSEAPQTAPVSPSTTSVDNKKSPEEDESKSQSSTEQLQSAKPDKSKLISRMAKMGQSMFPVQTAQSDSSEPDAPAAVTATSPRLTSASPTHRKPDVAVKPPHHQPINQNIAPNTVDSSMHQQPLPSQQVGPHLFQAPMAVNNMFQGSLPSSQLAVFQPQYPPPMGGFPQYMTQPFGSSVLAAAPNQLYSQQQAAPATSTTDTNMPMMMMETRQQNTEVRVSLSKICDKVDRVSDKLDQMTSQQNASLLLSNSLPTMEVSMLVHSIEKIVSENERMKKEVLEKSAHIDGLNTKIFTLIQQNQVYVEQSNALLEQRNVSYKSSAGQNQARVIELEQEKIELATKLSSNSSQLTESQLEITALKKRECELKLQLERLISSEAQSREELGSYKIQVSEVSHQLEQAASQLRDEQQQRKQLQTQVIDLQETVAELTRQRDAFEKGLVEKKQKSNEELLKMETEMKELQNNYEKELLSLKERLKHEKNSTEMTTAQQITQIEDDLNRQWKEKCDRMQASLQDKYQREASDLNNEKQLLEEKVRHLESKVQELKAVRDSSEQQIDGLKDEMDELRAWKEKYNGLRTQAVVMKQRYEDRVSELVEEVASVEQSRDSIEHQLNRALDAGRRLQAQLSQATSTSPDSKADTLSVQTEVKKVMNTVYRRLRAEFLSSNTYAGSEIHAVILGVIKSATLEVVQPEPVIYVQDNVNSPATTNVTQAATEDKLETPITSEQGSLLNASEPTADVEVSEEKSQSDKPDTSASEKQEGSFTSSESSADVSEEKGQSDKPDTSAFEKQEGPFTSSESSADIEVSEEKSHSDNPDTFASNKQEIILVTSDSTVDVPFNSEPENKECVDSGMTNGDSDKTDGGKTGDSDPVPESRIETDKATTEEVAEDVTLPASSTDPLGNTAEVTRVNSKETDVSSDISKSVTSELAPNTDCESVEQLVASSENPTLEQADEEDGLFTDARSDVSDQDANSNVISENAGTAAADNVQNAEAEDSPNELFADESCEQNDIVKSIPDDSPNNTTHKSKFKSKQVASIFDDDDDDDTLFSTVTSKYVPPRKIDRKKKKVPTATLR